MGDETTFAARRRLVSGGLVTALTAAGLGNARAASIPTQIDAVTLSGPFFNVKDFGAKGDAYPSNATPTDDTCAINLAIQAALKSYVGTPVGQLRTGGGIVLFPAGRYYVAGTINVSRTNFSSPCLSSAPCSECDPVHQGITLMGAGPFATTLVTPNNYGGATIAVSPGGVADVQFCCIKDLSIESVAARTTGAAITILGTGHSILNVNMLRQFMGCNIGNATQGTLDVSVEKGVWSQFSAGGVGLTLDGLGVSTHVRDLKIISQSVAPPPANQPLAGIRIRSASGWMMTNCEVLAVQYGLLVDPPAGKRVEFGTFTACQFDTCGYSCMQIFPAGGNAYSLTFVNSWSSAATLGNCCLVGSNTNGVEFIGHRFFAAGNGNGLFVQAPAVNVHVDASVASGIASAGFYFGPGVTKFAVRNSHSGPYGGPAGVVFPPNNYGVFVDAGCNEYIVSNNTLTGNSVQSFFDGSPSAANKIVSPNLT